MIRRFDPSDGDVVVGIWEAASEMAHPFLSAEFMAVEKEQVRTVHLNAAEVWVTEVDGEVLGFVALIGREVGAIFVHPRAHGSGYGLALMAHAQAVRGDLELEVFEKNTIGRAFYDTCGFELVDRRIHQPTGEPMLRLRLPADRSLGPAPQGC